MKCFKKLINSFQILLLNNKYYFNKLKRINKKIINNKKKMKSIINKFNKANK